MKRLSLSLWLAFLAAGLAGCNTPAARIDRNPTLFNSLPAADQERVRQGRVAVGFTAEMVRLALGEPDRIYTRTDAAGSSESWVYVSSGAGGDYFCDYGYGFGYGHYRRGIRPFRSYSLRYSDRDEDDRVKVQFKDGKVALVEERKSR